MTNTMKAMVIAAFSLVSGLAVAADASGTWSASFDTEVGKQEYTYVLKVQGAALTGTLKGNLITDSMLSDGKVDGSKISFTEKGSYMGMPLEFHYLGELAGDELKLKRELMGFPPEEFVAKRSK